MHWCHVFLSLSFFVEVNCNSFPLPPTHEPSSVLPFPTARQPCGGRTLSYMRGSGPASFGFWFLWTQKQLPCLFDFHLSSGCTFLWIVSSCLSGTDWPTLMDSNVHISACKMMLGVADTSSRCQSYSIQTWLNDTMEWMGDLKISVTVEWIFYYTVRCQNVQSSLFCPQLSWPWLMMLDLHRWHLQSLPFVFYSAVTGTSCTTIHY